MERRHGRFQQFRGRYLRLAENSVGQLASHPHRQRLVHRPSRRHGCQHPGAGVRLRHREPVGPLAGGSMLIGDPDFLNRAGAR
jgi:hypothetical protein